jgi:hypothetical protein
MLKRHPVGLVCVLVIAALIVIGITVTVQTEPRLVPIPRAQLDVTHEEIDAIATMLIYATECAGRFTAEANAYLHEMSKVYRAEIMAVVHEIDDMRREGGGNEWFCPTAREAMRSVLE